MRPLAVLNAIVFGSAAAITFGLTGVVIVFLVLRGSYPQMNTEFPSLVRASLVFTALALVSGASLFGTLKALRWQWAAQTTMWLFIAGIMVLYWPR